MYAATRYVKIDGVIFTKGEVIERDLPEAKRDWLLKAGAIEEVAPVRGDDEPREAETDAPEAEPMPADEDSPDAPAIDVMDGVVAEEKPKPKKKGGKRK